VAFLSLVVWATTMQHFGPARRSRWRYDLPGGLLTTVLWLAASYGLNLYVNTVVTTSPVFGALGGGLILMTWFYLLCASLLLGAELNAILLARRRHRARQQALAAAAEPPPDPEDPSSVVVEPQTVLLDQEQERVPTAPRPASTG
jgi:uncharacterized BrkB/YihY/UPF0761 family membrane protein